MFSIIHRDTGELRRFKQELPRMARRVVVRVANDAVPVAKQAILDGWNVSSQAVDQGVHVSESKNSSWFGGQDRPYASIIARGRRLNLLDFKATQTPSGVSFEIQRGRRQELKHAFITDTAQGYGRRGGQSKKAIRRVISNLKRQVNQGKWTAKASGFAAEYEGATKRYQLQRAMLHASGATRSGVFIRKTKARLPIKALYGGSVQAFFASSAVRGKIKRFVDRAIPEYLQIEMGQFFGRQ